MRRSRLALLAALLASAPAVWAPVVSAEVAVQAYPLPPGGGPHGVAVGADVIVW